MSISYLHLGATLFIPASHKDINAIVSGSKYPALKSIVIDFEDGLEEELFLSSMQRIESSFELISAESPLVFLRAKDRKHLKELLQIDSISNITGFVLAKFSLFSADEYLEVLSESKHLIMPSIEGEELFSHEKLHLLKEKIVANKERVLLVRYGLEDMLRQLSMRRSCEESLFDRAATASVLGNFIATFKSAGFAVSGGVYPCFKDVEGFVKDAKRDLKEGLFSKTIIHPSQIEPLHELYKVSKLAFEEAQEIEASDKKVFAQNSKMAETLTMKNYSNEILSRAKIYGIAN